MKCDLESVIKDLLEIARHLHSDYYDHEVGNPPSIGCHDCNVILKAQELSK